MNHVNTLAKLRLYVSIPKRASEAVNQGLIDRETKLGTAVSIPKRASEAVNRYGKDSVVFIYFVSIPKRASEAVNPASNYQQP